AEGRDFQSPGTGYITERQIAVVMKCKVVQLNLGYLLDQIHLGCQVRCVRTITYKVVVTNIFWKPIRNDNISIAIIVKICYQWRPAPVCLRNTAHETNITENRGA